jgi:DeoR/GlpR family transcriptional regulator of sugar metabolism
MKTSTCDNIQNYIKVHKKTTVKKLVDHFEITSQVIHRHLKKLLETNKISKIGSPPKSYYTKKEKILEKQSKLDLLKNKYKINPDSL